MVGCRHPLPHARFSPAELTSWNCFVGGLALSLAGRTVKKIPMGTGGAMGAVGAMFHAGNMCVMDSGGGVGGVGDAGDADTAARQNGIQGASGGHGPLEALCRVRRLSIHSTQATTSMRNLRMSRRENARTSCRHLFAKQLAWEG